MTDRRKSTRKGSPRKPSGQKTNLDRAAKEFVRLYKRAPGNLLSARKTGNRGGKS